MKKTIENVVADLSQLTIESQRLTEVIKDLPVMKEQAESEEIKKNTKNKRKLDLSVDRQQELFNNYKIPKRDNNVVGKVCRKASTSKKDSLSFGFSDVTLASEEQPKVLRLSFITGSKLRWEAVGWGLLMGKRSGFWVEMMSGGGEWRRVVEMEPGPLPMEWQVEEEGHARVGVVVGSKLFYSNVVKVLSRK